MTTNQKLTFDHKYNVRSYEPRIDGRVSITSICNHLQDIASRHADALGFGFHDLEKSGHLWVLSRLHVMVDRLPGFGETVRVQTWPSGNERLIANRDYLIHDADTLIGRATTGWVTLNIETRRPAKPDTILDGHYIPDIERSMVFPSKAITRLKDGEHTANLTARHSDQDINNHVNSVRYAEFCFEAVPATWTDENRCMGLDIQFRTESYAGDTYISSCSVSDPDQGMDTILHSLKRTSDDKEIVRMRSWWKKA